MGSLLPGWDTAPHDTPKGTPFPSSHFPTVAGIGAELLEERQSLEKEVHGGGRRPSVDTSAGKPPTGPPNLSRKSAPSSFIIRKLQMALPEEKDEPDQSGEKTSTEGGTSKVISSLFYRDKWWRKFSSAHLNELASDEENMLGAHTYKAQFDLVENDPFVKAAAAK